MINIINKINEITRYNINNIKKNLLIYLLLLIIS